MFQRDAPTVPDREGTAAAQQPVGPRSSRRRVPDSTYRLQFHAGFTFRDAAALVPYLAALGVTDCYCSSYLKAVPGSLHGYDVADPTVINPEVGTEDDYRAFVETLRAHGMGHLLDIVPNHMGIARSSNRWWQDVLENGPSSRYARFFDIDWQPIKRELADKVLLPILGDQYGAVLERQEILLRYETGVFRLEYFETRLPIAPRSYPRILRHGIDRLIAAHGEDHDDVIELLSIITSLERLPSRSDPDPAHIAERQREKEVAKRRLAELERRSPIVQAFLRENVTRFNGTPGDPASFDLLDGLLGDQAYRLAHWRVASEEINYRRFFDINELAAVRMEDPEVFDESHRLVFRLVDEGAVTGLRIDHVDGLYDPGDYLRCLQLRAGAGRGDAGDRPLFIVVEKILAPGEPLPAGWPVEGTTGYEFVNEVNGLFVDRRHAKAFDELYGRFTGDQTPFEDLAYRCKKLIMQIGMASEIQVLAHRLNLFSERNRHYRDFTLYSLVHAIREIIACFPVYRTYVGGGAQQVSDRDRTYIDQAVNEAKRRNPGTTGHVFDFIRDLLLKRADYIPEEDRDAYLFFVTRFQQTTSPVTAKGIEDTAFYQYNRLVSLNEVGGEPARFGVGPEDVHRWMEERQRTWSTALSTTSTHDTKRSEDVRARIDVLSEIPGEWRTAINRWARLNKRHRGTVDGRAAPDRNEEYLLYQTLVGAWPLDALDEWPDEAFTGRIAAYMVKTLREAKRHSSWLNPNTAWEEAVTGFVRQLLDPQISPAFLQDLRGFVARVAHCGMWNGLAQTLVKMTAPGVPDFYQGTEIWNFSLVDPDNRRPVDYERRRSLLDTLPDLGQPVDPTHLAEMLDARTDGRIKLLLIARALHLRRQAPDLFRDGDYVPLRASGARAPHVFAFARARAGEAIVTVVPRLTASLVPEPAAAPLGQAVWDDTVLALPPSLAAATWTNAITGESIHVTDTSGMLPMARVLERFPVAVLRGALDSFE